MSKATRSRFVLVFLGFPFQSGHVQLSAKSILQPKDHERAERFLAHLQPIQRQLELFCFRALNRPENIQDTLQAATANAYRDFDFYVQGTNFRAWIFRYVSLESLNRNRANQKLAVLFDRQEATLEKVLSSYGTYPHES